MPFLVATDKRKMKGRGVYMAFTFKGGIYVDEHKDTDKIAIEKMKSPDKVAIPLIQHIGAPVKPTVKKGDYVLAGQVIGRNDEALSCPVHASVSGVVSNIESRDSNNGIGKIEYIVIESDGLDAEIDCVGIKDDNFSLYEIINIVREAGISGMGGATFPTYAKIQSAAGKAKEIIVNCAECEPYITANHRLLLEDAESIISGAEILKKALNIEKVVFAVENNKKDAIKKLISMGANVAEMKTKYPQGDERQIMYALHGVQLPQGKLPADVGYVIFNAETCAAVHRAVREGRPLIRRIVTVAGDCIREPKNLSVPLGTSFADVIEYCGGLTKTPDKLISGGPMMGVAQWDINTPVVKGTAAILAVTEVKDKTDVSCIHCGKCVGVCPMHLTPNYLALFSSHDKYDLCESYNCMSCVECGCCTYICPGNVPIVQHIRKAKAAITEKRKRQKK